jgi:general secretion pathway protein A
MYLNHYGLDRPPFDPAPRADDLFETPTHNEALAALVYGILENKGFIVLLGEVGVGKTTVLRRALQYVAASEAKLLVVEIANPAIGPAALAARIHRALRLHFDAGVETDLDALRAELVRLADEGWRLLLVFDEAQSMPPATLEFARIMSNLANDGQALIQVVLCGQPELDAMLSDPTQRALRQRIAVRARIEPLTRRQVAAYVRFKLTRAGASPGAVLTRAAVRRVATASQGFPRRVNVIGDNLLIAGYGADRKPVGRRMARAVVRGLDDRPRPRDAWGLRLRRALAATAVLALALLGWTAIPSSFDRTAGRVEGPIAQPAAASAPAEWAPPLAAAAAPMQPTSAVPPEPSPVVVMTSSLAPRETLPDNPVTSVVAVAELPPAISPVGYRVKPGESLITILRNHAIAIDALTLARVRQMNPDLTDLDLVRVGQDILLPRDAMVAASPPR